MTEISENDFGFSSTESQKPIKITIFYRNCLDFGDKSLFSFTWARFNLMWLKVLKVREFLNVAELDCSSLTFNQSKWREISANKNLMKYLSQNRKNHWECLLFHQPEVNLRLV